MFLVLVPHMMAISRNDAALTGKAEGARGGASTMVAMVAIRISTMKKTMGPASFFEVKKRRWTIVFFGCVENTPEKTPISRPSSFFCRWPADFFKKNARKDAHKYRSNWYYLDHLFTSRPA